MIKDILEILTKMESACIYECFPSIAISPTGDLILKWVWDEDGEIKKYSELITPEYDNCNIDVISLRIDHARQEIYKLVR